MGDSAYSFSLTTFSRTGRLLQIEYALNAVANGRTALGICAVDGVVIATDKKLPSVLVDTPAVHKIEMVTPSTGFSYAGVGPDYRVLGMCVCVYDCVCV
jgi:20S proteasome subunit alpha 2